MYAVRLIYTLTIAGKETHIWRNASLPIPPIIGMDISTPEAWGELGGYFTIDEIVWWADINIVAVWHTKSQREGATLSELDELLSGGWSHDQAGMWK